MKIGMTADIKEVNRYQFDVEVDDNLSKEEQNAQGKAKLTAFLDENIPYPFQSTPINGVTCVDRESGISMEDTVTISVNED